MNEISAFELSERLTHLLARERACMAEFVSALAEFDRRQLWRELGYTSLFYYCVRGLGLPKASAWRRATAAALAGRFPIVAEMLGDGRLSLRSLAQLREVLTEANHAEVLARAAGLSDEQAELLALEYKPRPVPRETNRPVRMPEPAEATARPIKAPPPGETVRPLTPVLRRLSVNVSIDFARKLETARGLLSHRVPDGDFEKVVGEALDALIEREQRRKAALTEHPRPSRPRAPKGRSIPAAVRRAVWRRDGGRCSWPVADGKPCGSTHQLEFDHNLEVALGGPSTLENVRLLCGRHNRIKAEMHLGREFMRSFGHRGSAPASSKLGVGSSARPSAMRPSGRSRDGPIRSCRARATNRQSLD